MRRFYNAVLAYGNALFLRVPERYRVHIPSAALLLGLVWDFLTLGRPDQVYGNILILVHFVLAGGSILLLNARRARGEGELALPLTVIMQFSFGSLASALLLFYGQSGTLAGNWLFLTLFAAILIGNELVRNRYALAAFHSAVLYLLLFAYFALIVPIALDRMGTPIFALSGAISLVTISGFLGLLYLIAPRETGKNLRSVGTVIALIFVSMNALYAFNLIPPVPLALRSMEVYHHVSRLPQGGYEVLYESASRETLWRFLPFHTPTVHYVPGQNLYCFSAVFAPAGLATPIRHRWESYDAAAGSWQTESLISFPIRGGRDEGFRGFTIKRPTSPGLWRCAVETERGLLIGRTSFNAVAVPTASQLSAEIR